MPTWRKRQTHQVESLAVDKTMRDRGPPSVPARPESAPLHAQLKGIRHTSLTQNQWLLRSNRRLGTIAGKLIQMSVVLIRRR